MKGKVFRIGHLGNMDELMLARCAPCSMLHAPQWGGTPFATSAAAAAAALVRLFYGLHSVWEMAACWEAQPPPPNLSVIMQRPLPALHKAS